ncbi:hypothetical protein ABIE67_009544 [Streptomyces sp. V4I8]
MAQIPVDEDGNRLCLWCGALIAGPHPRVSRWRAYCTRTHRKFARTYREAMALRRMGYALTPHRLGPGGNGVTTGRARWRRAVRHVGLLSGRLGMD